MKIVVQKFGGTSLATPELREKVCETIIAAKEEGYAIVVVVSAMGRVNEPYATDTLINLVKQINENPPKRELDMIMSCGEILSGSLLTSKLIAEEIKSVFFTGEQAGIITDGNYGDAHILYVNPKKIFEYLENDFVVVVAGFQGVTEEGELTTLGRGGSDTTASALGVAINAEVIDIFTDVEGIMTADPRVVENARLLDVITYNEVCQLAREGAKVVHPRAVEIAMQKSIPLRIRSTFTNSLGTMVTHNINEAQTINIMRDRLITGITYTSNISQIRILINDIKDRKEIELKIFKSLALANISVDFISVQPDLIMFTVFKDSLEKALEVLKNLDIYPEIEVDCSKVAIVGAAMTGIPGIMAKIMEALTEEDITLLQSGDSYTNIWCLVKKTDMQKAVKALHNKFQLGNKN
ncbi:Aspartokinase [Candidatus Syntrophocurvum alkaliphilum]|uniref:Aspartokinase n=1 Tax=Candidatus Syntrophocurvum alkaliphilum TaxID=2293317 RepID=A0A6I6DA73_9FIRM|nr:aspartate kinase [Candidatus Syntrophocurvum alkaliphilum]QGT99655.1 Aspartokinase [Candidatus Syntrophocurvum alkaliphilum]